jgi:hypothetical protein
VIKEADAFRWLLWVVGVLAAIVAIYLIVRAVF